MPGFVCRKARRNDVLVAIYLAARDIERITGRSFESILDDYEGCEGEIFIEALGCLEKHTQSISIPSIN